MLIELTAPEKAKDALNGLVGLRDRVMYLTRQILEQIPEQIPGGLTFSKPKRIDGVVLCRE
jgi:hypothetical protein